MGEGKASPRAARLAEGGGLAKRLRGNVPLPLRPTRVATLALPRLCQLRILQESTVTVHVQEVHGSRAQCSSVPLKCTSVIQTLGCSRGVAPGLSVSLHVIILN